MQQHRITRRRIAGIAMALALIGSGLGSLAALNDTLTVTNQYSTASIDLQGNAQQSVTWTAPVAFPATAYDQVFALTVSNAGTAQLRYSAAQATTFTPPANNWGSFAFKITVVANVGACVPGSPVGTQIASSGLSTGTLFGNATAGQDTGDRLLAAGASEVLCLQTSHASPTIGNSDSATQTITFSAESTGI